MKRKSVMNPKTALMTSVLSMLLCVAMFVGTTYAWFSSSVTNTQNNIMAGTLDIALEYYDASMITSGSTNGGWVEVDENTKIFDPDAKYEPGYTEVVYLRVVNKGSLALKYQLGVSVNEEQLGINQAGKQFKLSDYIMFGVAETDVGANTYEFSAYNKTDADRKAAREAVAGSVAHIGMGYRSKPAVLNAEDNKIDYLTMVVYMPEEVGNEANAQPGKEASINLAIDLMAVQTQYEDDSFGIGYDKDAEAGVIPTAKVRRWSALEVAAMNNEQTFVPIDLAAILNGASLGTVFNQGVANKHTGGGMAEFMYTFDATDDSLEADANYYAKWIADFYVSFDRDVKANSVGLIGHYASFFNDFLYFDSPIDIAAGEIIPLLTPLDLHMDYEGICTVVKTFTCGAYNKALENVGTTMNVQLRLTNRNDSSDYRVIGSYSHTFTEEGVNMPDMPHATVTEYQGEASNSVYTLDKAYSFIANEPNIDESPYKTWFVDFAISFDDYVALDSIVLGGQYSNWDLGWVMIEPAAFNDSFNLGLPSTLEPGQEVVLLEMVTKSYSSGWEYQEIVRDVGTFHCGVKNLAAENAGKTMTIELRLYNPDKSGYCIAERIQYVLEAPTTTP